LLQYLLLLPFLLSTQLYTTLQLLLLNKKIINYYQQSSILTACNFTPNNQQPLPYPQTFSEENFPFSCSLKTND